LLHHHLTNLFSDCAILLGLSLAELSFLPKIILFIDFVLFASAEWNPDIPAGCSVSVGIDGTCTDNVTLPKNCKVSIGKKILKQKNIQQILLLEVIMIDHLLETSNN